MEFASELSKCVYIRHGIVAHRLKVNLDACTYVYYSTCIYVTLVH